MRQKMKFKEWAEEVRKEVVILGWKYIFSDMAIESFYDYGETPKEAAKSFIHNTKN